MTLAIHLFNKGARTAPPLVPELNRLEAKPLG